MLNLKKAIRNDNMRGLLLYLAETQATPKTITEYMDFTRSHVSVILGEMVKLGILERNQRFDGGCKYTFYKTTFKGRLLLESHGYSIPIMKMELKQMLKEVENG